MKIYLKENESCYNNLDVTINKISKYLGNYNKLSNQEYYKFISFFYNIELENKDYIDYLNLKTGNNFNNVIKINTNVIDSYIESEGHGRDFSYWTVKVRLVYNVATNIQLEDRIYTIDEINKLISENKIYPLCSAYEKCDEKLKENIIETGINCLIKDNDKKININSEYFNFVVNNIINELTTEEILMTIRYFIINLKLNLADHIIVYRCFDEEKDRIDELVNNLIDKYNKTISIYYKDSYTIENKIIVKNNLDIIIEYISRLPLIDKEAWFKEITIDQIHNAMNEVYYDEDKERCDKLEKAIIELGDSNLCSSIAYVDWINTNKMLDIIIENKDDVNIHYLLRDYAEDIDKNYLKRLIEVIIESDFSSANYELAKKTDLGVIDVRRHGQAIINSGDVWYNYLFARDIEGADIRAHGEVVINSGDVYYNSLFAQIPGADKERHYEVVRLNDKEIQNKSSLTKKKSRK